MSLDRVTKVYRDGTIALRDVSYEYGGTGSLLLFIGPNGAGKTTLLRIVGGQLLPTSGRVYLLGYDVVREFDRVKRLLSFLPQDIRLPFYTLTPFKYIVSYLMVRGYSLGDARRTARRVIEELGLESFAGKRVSELSGGQAKLAAVAMVLAAEDAEVYILDEPYTGLDPRVRLNVFSYLRKLCRNGASVLIASHYLEEPMGYSDEVVVLDKSKVLVNGPPGELMKAFFKGSTRKVVAKECSVDVKSLVGEYCPECTVVNVGDYAVVYRVSDTVAPLLVSALATQCSVEVLPVGLGDVVIMLTAKG